MPQKSRSTVSFRIKRSSRTKQFRCIVSAANGEVIFTGESCKNRKDVKKMVENFISAVLELRYEVIDETIRVSAKPKHFEGKLNRNWP